MIDDEVTNGFRSVVLFIFCIIAGFHLFQNRYSILVDNEYIGIVQHEYFCI